MASKHRALDLDGPPVTDLTRRIMQNVGDRDTTPELAVRRALHRAGLRFVLHDRRLPGRPDIVLPRWKTAIFVHGCFWHRHPGCPYATMPKTRSQFWSEKFERNVARDAANRSELEALGWRVVEVWECDIKKRRFEEPLLSMFRRQPRSRSLTPT
ncbi:very short patch repair endonuclease [Brevundimonas sp.]|uniref:very short patch repair endonuclease n=1 Tax=Brevundimonas sp. TaxID=1871086 RepID=UPI002ED9D0EE